MSNAFAIAAVTAALKRLLREQLVQVHSDTGALPANFVVSAEAPDRIDQAPGAASRLNLFLYDVAPNSGWSAKVAPVRDPRGDRVENPPLALDLFYLLSAHGVAELDAEILLGHALQVLHETPGLSRGALRKLLDPDDTDNVAGSPQNFREQAILIADQFESIRLLPCFKRPDEMSKLWTSIQSHYRASVLYQANVVLIESRRSVRNALPVLARGPGDIGPQVATGLTVPTPTLLVALPPNRQSAVRPIQKLKLYGHHLRGTEPKVTLRHSRLGFELTVEGTGGGDPALVIRPPDPDNEDFVEKKHIPDSADTCVVVDLDKAVGTRAAGWHSVEFTVRLDGEPESRISNALTVALAPRFVLNGAGAPSVTALGSDRYRAEITCQPSLQPAQVASLLLAQRELIAEKRDAVAARVAFTGTLGANMSGASHLARLRVDGVDSLFINIPAEGAPTFDATQVVSVP